MNPRTDKTWLATLIRKITEAASGPPAICPDPVAREAFCVAALAARGFSAGLLVDRLGALELREPGAPFADYSLLNATAHLIELGDALLRGARPGLPRRDRAHRLLEILAWLVDDAALVARCEVLEPGADEAASQGAVLALAERLQRRALPSDHPLLGHPFHQLCLYFDARLMCALAWEVAHRAEAPDHAALIRAQGAIGADLYESLSACVALAAADGRIDADERRFLDALAEAAQLDETERAMLTAELSAPLSPAELAARITDPPQQAFVIQLLSLTAAINAQVDPAERAFIAELGGHFGLDQASLDRAEYEALGSLETFARLPSSLGLGQVIERARRRLTGRIEEVIQSNAARIWTELRETGDLATLLAREATGERLSSAEHERIRAQLKDLARVVPALALFAAPGGSILLPLLIKHLPIDLRPSSFKDPDPEL